MKKLNNTVITTNGTIDIHMKVRKKTKLIIDKLVYKLSKPIKAEIVQLASNQLLRNRVALITGGSKGIGYAIAKVFIEAGAYVVITGRTEELLNNACTLLGGEEHALGIVMDNSNISCLKERFLLVINELEKRNKQLDILVNNAGLLGGVIWETTEDEYDKVIDTNLKGTFFISKLVSRYMIKNKIKGNILNIASSSSLRPAISAYTLSKWGIRGLTMGLARSLSKYGITVNGIAPGQTLTPMMKKENDNLLNKTCLLGRWILPEEIANGALFLVSEQGRAVVGDILYMTGGSGVISFEDMNYDCTFI